MTTARRSFFSAPKCVSGQLVKSFHRVLRSSLRLKISSRLDLPSQAKILKPVGLLPFRLRIFKRFCYFIFKSFRTGRPRSLLSRYERAQRLRDLRESSCRPFVLPTFSLVKYGRVSFLRCSTYLLKSFFFKYVQSSSNAESLFSVYLPLTH